ncbi:MAG: transcriptional repressor [Firmicutes bacterium]|nr:transcriptional repressor [Bacillota bacterium]
MEANDIHWPEGVKKTRMRQLVLSVLMRAEKPLGAMEVSSILEQTGESAWLSTVYRTLEFFAQKGMLVKTSVADSDVALYEMNRDEHHHYAVCLTCRRILPLTECPLEHISLTVNEPGFRVTGHHLEVSGYCKECSK